VADWSGYSSATWYLAVWKLSIAVAAWVTARAKQGVKVLLITQQSFATVATSLGW
jgi:hypothetical protein